MTRERLSPEQAALVTSNTRLVAAIAGRYCRRLRALDLGDLLQEGHLGLIRAAHRYDPARGVPFGSYAAKWIQGAIARAIGVDLRRRERPAGRLDRATARPPGLVPLFPISAFTPRSTCPHQVPIAPGSALCCMVCHRSGMEGHPALQRDPRTDPAPEPRPAPPPEPGAESRETRRERRRRRFLATPGQGNPIDVI
jgi:RNA polymerase sigma factor (sigma-70 family)